jgi:hypothetical protein
MNASTLSSSDMPPKTVVIRIHVLLLSWCPGHALSSAFVLNRHGSANVIDSTANMLQAQRSLHTSSLPGQLVARYVRCRDHAVTSIDPNSSTYREAIPATEREAASPTLSDPLMETACKPSIHTDYPQKLAQMQNSVNTANQQIASNLPIVFIMPTQSGLQFIVRSIGLLQASMPKTPFMKGWSEVRPGRLSKR